MKAVFVDSRGDKEDFEAFLDKIVEMEKVGDERVFENIRSFNQAYDRKINIETNAPNSNISRIVKIPKIPRSDIRRKYPLMLLNTLNSMDSNLLRKFFFTFAHPQTILRRQVMSPHHPSMEASSVSFYGQEEIFYFLFMLQLFGPDRVIQLETCSITTRSTTFLTEIQLDCTLHVNALYEWDAVAVQNYIYDMRSRCSSSSGVVSSLERGLRDRFRFLTNPKKVTIRPKFVLLIYNFYCREELDEVLFQTPIKV